MPRARNGKSGGYQTRSVSRLGGWVRWIGCAAVWEAGRAVCGERRLQQTQGYSPTATEDDGVGRGDIHTYAIELIGKGLNSICWTVRFIAPPHRHWGQGKHSARASTGSRWPTERAHARTLWACARDGGGLSSVSAEPAALHPRPQTIWSVPCTVREPPNFSSFSPGRSASGAQL